MKLALVTLGLIAWAAIAASGIAGAAAQEDAQMTFNNFCRNCHTVGKGDNRLGPSLYCVIGKQAGTVEGFEGYSPSMKGAGFEWTEETMDRFLASPDSVVPGNNMKPFPGVGKAEERALIIEFLKASC